MVPSKGCGSPYVASCAATHGEAVAMTLYALAKSEFAVSLNRFNRYAYATE